MENIFDVNIILISLEALNVVREIVTACLKPKSPEPQPRDLRTISHIGQRSYHQHPFSTLPPSGQYRLTKA